MWQAHARLCPGSFSAPHVCIPPLLSHFWNMMPPSPSCFVILFWHELLQITPFREVDMHGSNVETMRRFNYQHAKMWVVVENAFGRLKGRWHILRMIYAHAGLSASVQEACVALHNFLEARDAAYDEDLEVPDEQPGSSPMAGAGSNTLLSAGQARRVEIV